MLKTGLQLQKLQSYSLTGAFESTAAGLVRSPLQCAITLSSKYSRFVDIWHFLWGFCSVATFSGGTSALRAIVLFQIEQCSSASRNLSLSETQIIVLNIRNFSIYAEPLQYTDMACCAGSCCGCCGAEVNVYAWEMRAGAEAQHAVADGPRY